MPDLGNSSVFSQTDGSNNSGTQPSWSGSAAPSTLDDAGRGLQGAVTREWNWRSFTLTAAGTADAKTLTYSVAPAAYYNGQRFAFIANTTNTGSATLNVNSLGAKTIKKVVAGALTNLSASDMVSGAFIEVSYNTANDCFVWNNALPQALSTSDSPQFAGINVGNASDTTITRSAAGVIAVEGGNVPLENRANTFTAAQIISVTDNTNPALRITQLGTGLALYVEDSANPDATPFAVSAGGDVGVGTASPSAKLDVIGPAGGTSLRLTDNTNSTLTVKHESPSNLVTYESGGVASQRWVTNAVERMRIDSAGDVLITSNSLSIGNTDTTIARSAAGVIAVEGNPVITASGTASQGDVLYHNGTAWTRLAAGTSGQFLKTNGAGANPAWASETVGGYTLLGTLTTTSGASQSLTSLNLTGYKFLRFVINGVSSSSTGGLDIGTMRISTTNGAVASWLGILDVDLGTGIGSVNLGSSGAGVGEPRVGNTGYSTATTSVSATISSGTFDGGSITVYGIP